MKDITTTPLTLLSETRQLSAPCWGRRYMWPAEYGLRLLENVVHAGSEQHYMPFDVITVGIRPENPLDLMIVDGHQRLVTFALILLALVHSLRERNSGILCDGSGARVSTDAEIIAKYMYLPREHGTCERRLRLYTEVDDDVLQALIEGNRPSQRLRTSNMCKPYDAFLRRMAKIEQLNVIFDGLNEQRGGLMEMHGSERQLARAFVRMNMAR